MHVCIETEKEMRNDDYFTCKIMPYRDKVSFFTPQMRNINFHS